MDFKKLLLECREILDEHKAEDIKLLDLEGLSGIAEYFVIASSKNVKHSISLADYVEEHFEKQGLFVHHKEGANEGDWVVLDYIDFIVHVFTEEKREYYALDKVWSKAKLID